MSNSQESPLQFPCEFPIKAMGFSDVDFETTVTRIVSQHVPEFERRAVTTRKSRGGRYLAVTITIWASSRAQLDAIYQDLTDCEQVIIAL